LFGPIKKKPTVSGGLIRSHFQSTYFMREPAPHRCGGDDGAEDENVGGLQT
jgi:hypothetical protein